MQNPKDTAPGANATGKTTLSRRQLLDGGFGIGAVSADRGNCWGGRPRARQYGHVAKHGRRGRQARPRDGPAAASSPRCAARPTACCARRLRGRLRLPRYRRLSALPQALRRRQPGSDAAHDPARPAHPADQRLCRRTAIALPADIAAAAPLQHHQFPFPRRRTSARAASPTISSARWSPARATTSRSRIPDDHTARHLLVPPAPPRQRRRPDHQRHGRRADRRGRFRRRAGDRRRRASAC